MAFCVLCCCLAFRGSCWKTRVLKQHGGRRETRREIRLVFWPCRCNTYSRMLHEVDNIARVAPLTRYTLLNEPPDIDRVHTRLLSAPARMTRIKASGRGVLPLGAPAFLSAQVSGANVPALFSKQPCTLGMFRTLILRGGELWRGPKTQLFSFFGLFSPFR